MITLFIFNLVTIALITVFLIIIKKRVRTQRVQNIILIAASVCTVLLHYSMLFYHAFGGSAIDYLRETPNLLLPIYPCNIVMWGALLYGLLRDQEHKLAVMLSDYLFWFGTVSTLVGMFVNVDFIKNPTLSDYEVTKSIAAHATLLFNVLLIPTFGRLRPSFFRNLRSISVSVVVMYVVGLYCNLVYSVLVSEEMAYEVNSMFLLHSPFEGVPFLRYPFIAAIGLLIYFIVFTVCDIVTLPRGARWFNRVFSKKN